MKAQKVGFMKKQFWVSKQYSFDLFYIASSEMVARLKKKFSNFEDDKPNKEKEFAQWWFDIPSEYVNYDDGIICVETFFDGNGILSTENFLSKKKGDLNKYSISPLCYDDTPVYIASFIKDKNYIKINSTVANILVASNKRFFPIAEMLFNKNDVNNIFAPDSSGYAHWKRNDDLSMRSFIENVPNVEVLQGTSEYYECSNFVLYDKPGMKWISNHLKKVRGVMYYDYDNETIEFWRNFDKTVIFGGYLIPFHSVLDEFKNSSDEKKGVVCAKELPTSFETKEQYEEHLSNLSKYETCELDASTPKYRIAECVKLGVKPVAVDDTIILDDTKIEEYGVAYYDSHLSQAAMRRILITNVLS